MRKPTILLHTFLFAAYPVIAMLSFNIAHTDISSGYRPLILALILAGLLLLCFQLLLRNWAKASLMASLSLLLFFSYGHIYNILSNPSSPLVTFGRHRYMLVAWSLILISCMWLIWKKLKNPQKLILTLNIISFIALIPPISNLTISVISNINAKSQAIPFITPSNLNVQSADERLPDIYYIVMDSYTRQDVLQAIFQFDNEPFLNELEKLGFFIARESRSNYTLTPISIGSALNMAYMEDYINIPELDVKPDDITPALLALQHSMVRSILKDLGYKFVFMDSANGYSQIPDADYTFSYADSPETLKFRPTKLMDFYITPFESLVLESTGGVLLLNLATTCANATNSGEVDVQTQTLRTRLACQLGGWLLPLINHPFESLRNQILYTFDMLPMLPDMGSPRFVFAHMIAPHHPFVFGPNGESNQYGIPFSLDQWSAPDAYLNGYRDELIYLNKRLLEVVDKILSNADIPPIIIIQGDHGSAATIFKAVPNPPPMSYEQERYAILNAYYLPATCDTSQLSDRITQVNTFRLVFNACFGGNYEILEDHFYSIYYANVYQIEDITEKVLGRSITP